MYLLKISENQDETPPPPQAFQARYEFLTDATDHADLIAIVSYGPDGLPGGEGSGVPDDRRKQLRLFTETPEDQRDIAEFDLRRRVWFAGDPNDERAMSYFNLVEGPDSDDIIYKF